jgi:hypothetical protein
MRHVKKFNEHINIEDINMENPYLLQRIGSPLTQREKDIIEKRVLGDGFFSKIFESNLNLDKIRNEDHYYYIPFLDSVVLYTDKFDELCDLVFLNHFLKNGKYKKVRSFLEKSKVLNSESGYSLAKRMVLRYLDEKKFVYIDPDLVEEDKDVYDLINYISAYF